MLIMLLYVEWIYRGFNGRAGNFPLQLGQFHPATSDEFVWCTICKEHVKSSGYFTVRTQMLNKLVIPFHRFHGFFGCTVQSNS